MLKLILVCVVIKINVAQNLGIISLIATSIFVHMCCKKKKDKLFDQKWENEIKEILHDRKY